MAIKVLSGPYSGHVIRKARVPHRCANWRAAEVGNAPDCSVNIKDGHYYLEDEVDPYAAGGFGKTKLCMSCAGLEAQSMIDHQALAQLQLQQARSFGLADEWGRFDRKALQAALEAAGR